MFGFPHFLLFLYHSFLKYTRTFEMLCRIRGIDRHGPVLPLFSPFICYTTNLRISAVGLTAAFCYLSQAQSGGRGLFEPFRAWAPPGDLKCSYMRRSVNGSNHDHCCQCGWSSTPVIAPKNALGPRALCVLGHYRDRMWRPRGSSQAKTKHILGSRNTHRWFCNYMNPLNQ